MNTPGCVELTYNHGSETEGEGKIYNVGNSDSTGTADGNKIKDPSSCLHAKTYVECMPDGALAGWVWAHGYFRA